MTIRCVGIVGLGLIGGSLARDLAAAGIRVLAHDADPASLRAALDEGVVAAPLGQSLECAGDADAIVIALPLSAALEVIAACSRRLAEARLVTDVCSTKYTIGEAARRSGLEGRFVGSHPLAGDHLAGWAASRRDLFRDAVVYVCPTPDLSAEHIVMLRQLWEIVGAAPEIIDARQHDELLAWTSHLPQATSTALARALVRAGIGLDRLGRGGRDMTRLAHSAAHVWTPIALDNAASLARALAALEAELATLRAALARGDHEEVRRFFDAGSDDV